ncbi:hypothetical protein LIS82_05095 [Cytobacillus solani]|nr:hypothetical protein [Cytobacillus solani]USK55908.1 hypothetical protein LIS82_05095 [Cytobacillus solani]
MVTFWFTKVKLGLNQLNEVPTRYYDQVHAKLIEADLYDQDGNEIAA